MWLYCRYPGAIFLPPLTSLNARLKEVHDMSGNQGLKEYVLNYNRRPVHWSGDILIWFL